MPASFSSIPYWLHHITNHAPQVRRGEVGRGIITGGRESLQDGGPYPHMAMPHCVTDRPPPLTALRAAIAPSRGQATRHLCCDPLSPSSRPELRSAHPSPTGGEGNSCVLDEHVPLSPSWERGGLEAIASPQGRGEGDAEATQTDSREVSYPHNYYLTAPLNFFYPSPSTSRRAASPMGPRRTTTSPSRVTSTTVEGVPPGQVPPSSTSATPSPSEAAASRAVRAGGSSERLALETASAPPHARITSRVVG